MVCRSSGSRESFIALGAASCCGPTPSKLTRSLRTSSAGSTPLEQYWEDGPQLTGWGDVVAKYPDGTAAAVQGVSGKGSVVLVGVHPEATDSWRHGMTFRTPSTTDNAFAATLIEAALNGTSLRRFQPAAAANR